MKFMLMMNTPAGGEYQIMSWPKQDIEAHIAFMMDFNKQLSASGELVDCQGLSAPSQAKLVRAGKDRKPVTDGVFAESKEFLAGYWIVDVPSAARAYELAAQISLAPGIGGEPLYMSVEVRQVGVAPKD
ncbi:MAG TPA: YciI family protein [Steroidobacter sp.]|uniref:YciI family protein n=1 Tax=Steroidobacter sp. TaxID=1978227 RepID=UPI002EDABDFD